MGCPLPPQNNEAQLEKQGVKARRTCGCGFESLLPLFCGFRDEIRGDRPGVCSGGKFRDKQTLVTAGAEPE